MGVGGRLGNWVFPPLLLKGRPLWSTDHSSCPTEFIRFEGKLKRCAGFQTPGVTAWRRKEFSVFTAAQLTLVICITCRWCIKDISSFLQINKNRSIWVTYLLWLEVKQLEAEMLEIHLNAVLAASCIQDSCDNIKALVTQTEGFTQLQVSEVCKTLFSCCKQSNRNYHYCCMKRGNYQTVNQLSSKVLVLLSYGILPKCVQWGAGMHFYSAYWVKASTWNQWNP